MNEPVDGNGYRDIDTDFPSIPGDTLKTSTMERDGKRFVVMYEMTGDSQSERYIITDPASLVTDPDANRNL